MVTLLIRRVCLQHWVQLYPQLWLHYKQWLWRHLHWGRRGKSFWQSYFSLKFCPRFWHFSVFGKYAPRMSHFPQFDNVCPMLGTDDEAYLPENHCSAPPGVWWGRRRGDGTTLLHSRAHLQQLDRIRMFLNNKNNQKLDRDSMFTKPSVLTTHYESILN